MFHQSACVALCCALEELRTALSREGLALRTASDEKHQALVRDGRVQKWKQKHPWARGQRGRAHMCVCTRRLHVGIEDLSIKIKAKRKHLPFNCKSFERFSLGRQQVKDVGEYLPAQKGAERG